MRFSRHSWHLAFTIPFFFASDASAQEVTRPAYQMFRSDEDWSFLADDARRTDSLDALKYVSLGRPHWYITLAGEIRERYELLDEPGFGLGPKDTNGYLLQRYLLSSDFHLGSSFRIFLELQSGLENGRKGGPRPTDVDRIDPHQAFFDWKLSSSETHEVSLRVGRQEIGFGSGRLISPAEGLNVRRSMDGARLMVRTGKLAWNVMALRLVRTVPGSFDDVPDHRQSFWGAGVAAPHPFWKRASVSLYYVGLDRRDSVFEKGIGRGIRHTIGSRSWKNTAQWDFNYEGIAQWGSFRGLPIRAWALSEDTGYTLSRLRFRPRFSVRADIASGDGGRKDRTLGSFDPLFPAAPVYSGPSGVLGATNLIDVTPSIRFPLRKTLSLTLESSSFWRESLGDGVYNPLGILIRRGEVSQARYVTTAPSATITWQENRHLLYTVIYSHFFAGRFFDDALPARNVNFVATWVSFRF